MSSIKHIFSSNLHIFSLYLNRHMYIGNCLIFKANYIIFVFTKKNGIAKKKTNIKTQGRSNG